ncbi:unnamed protein product, partial [Mesorhabditis belari]|uniref:CAAX prenyl protease 2 n=1 Tax=Mesorhabditis belari TaxID=2138241 RepID=A0AAF3EVZ4_9BILA
MGCRISLPLSAAIPVSYVLLLYVFDHGGIDRNDAKSVRKRFVAALVNNVLSLGITYHVLSQTTEEPLRLMGIRQEGLLAAALIPTGLLGLLYSGQFLMMYYDGYLQQLFSYTALRNSLQQWTWLRDVIVAPVTEEIAFRGCAAALMSTCLSPVQTIFIAPLSFSLSHLHHIGDDLRKGAPLKVALMKRIFQSGYTYIFGAYATFLFLRTGHLVAPIITHSLCNNLGLPLLQEIGNYKHRYQRVSLWIAYVFGFVGFAVLVDKCTTPTFCVYAHINVHI